MYRLFMVLGTSVWAVAFASCVADPALAQECPRASTDGPNTVSEIRTLEGQLVFHDGIRKWFELKLNEPTCEQNSIELAAMQETSPPIPAIVGCHIKSTGPIELSPTGYYSLDLFQAVETIEPIGVCEQQQVDKDYTESMPDRRIRAYRVDMSVDYRPGDHPVVFHVSSKGRELRPWQAYASYWLTGGLVLYGQCGDGFVVEKVFGTAQAHPMHFLLAGMPGDMAAFDPERAAAAGKRDLHLGYTCIRASDRSPINQ